MTCGNGSPRSSGATGGAMRPLPSFVGTLASGQGDVAARSQEILREEMGRDARRSSGVQGRCSPPLMSMIAINPAAWN